MPVSTRESWAVSPLSGARPLGRPLGRLDPLAPEIGAEACSSTMLFHSPQLSHRPAHFDEAAPQDWQTKLEAFAMTIKP
jgi:hypothetical protein